MTRGRGTAGERSKMKLKIIDGDRIVLMEIEGTDAALSEQMRNLAGALQGQVRGQLPAGRPASPSASRDVRDDEGEREEESPEADVDQGSADVSNDIRPRKPRAKPVPPKPQLVKDLETHVEPMPLPRYCEGLGLDSASAKHTSRYLVIAQWLKDHRGIDRMSFNHAYHCYKMMNWTGPEDFSQPLKDMARKNDWFASEAGGLYAINSVGEQQVRLLRGGSN